MSITIEERNPQAAELMNAYVFCPKSFLGVIARDTTSHILERPVEHSNMYPSLSGPNSAAFPRAKSKVTARSRNKSCK